MSPNVDTPPTRHVIVRTCYLILSPPHTGLAIANPVRGGNLVTQVSFIDPIEVILRTLVLASYNNGGIPQPEGMGSGLVITFRFQTKLFLSRFKPLAALFLVIMGMTMLVLLIKMVLPSPPSLIVVELDGLQSDISLEIIVWKLA